MDTLKKQVRRAQRRLLVQTFLRVLPWCWFAGLLAAALLIGIDKVWPLGIAAWTWPAAAVGLGVLAALVWTMATRHSALDAAIEIDRRFGLRERISSCLTLDESSRELAAGRALVDDALRRAERIHVSERFGFTLSRWAWAPLAPAALAFALAVFWNPVAGQNAAEGTETNLAKKEIKRETDLLRKQLIARRQEAREKGLKDAEQIFQKIEQGAKDLSRMDDADRKKAMVELNDFAKELEKRREALGGADKVKDQFKNLKDMQRGPADKFAEALKDGDFQQAVNELRKLQEQIESGKLSPKQKEDLAKQLDAMQSKLTKMTEAHQKAMDELEKKIAQKRAAGDNDAADKLQEQLDRLAQQAAQMKQADRLAQQLGECAECLKQGQDASALEGLEGMEVELSQLQQQLDEMEMLDAAMGEIGDCKDCIGGFARRMTGPPGSGLGEGRGQGDRPEDRTSTGSYDSRVRQKIGRGSAVITDFVHGPNAKGNVEQEIKAQFESARSDAADPLTGQPLPRKVREHARDYFDSLREGE